jgi:hypothetical protein
MGGFVSWLRRFIHKNETLKAAYYKKGYNTILRTYRNERRKRIKLPGKTALGLACI